MILARRSFLTGLATLIAAPAIVRASSLMPIRAPKLVPATDIYAEVAELLRKRMNEAYQAMDRALVQNLFGVPTPHLVNMRRVDPQFEYKQIAVSIFFKTP